MTAGRQPQDVSLAEHGGRSIGSDTSQGPGWWLASDGRWYPPELSPENRAKNKKKHKKKASSSSSSAGAEPAGGGATTTGTTTGDAGSARAAEGSTAGPRAGKATAGKAAAAKAGRTRPPRASSTHRSAAADAAPAGGGDNGVAQHEAVLHFDDDAPPTDQIVARRIQAREQQILLADLRQEAARRALSNLGIEPDGELVGVGARPAERASTTTTASPPPTVEPAEVREPVEAAPAAAPPAGATPAAERGSGDEPAPVATGEAARTEAAPRGEVPAPHQPTKRPEPVGGAMGTEVPFMEVRGSALGTDIERIGEKILIFADRVELRDRGNTIRQTIPYDQLARVVIQKRIMGPTLLIESTTGETVTAKALRPELATGAKAMIEKHARRFVGAAAGEPALAMASAPAPTAAAGDPAPATVELRAGGPPARLPHKHVLAAMLDELHAAGVLDAREHAEKLALLESLSPGDDPRR